MPQSPDQDNTRQIKQSGTRWRYKDIPNRYLGIGKTNEAQEMFDSGYIGDNGIGNQDMRLHVYYGNLIVDTDEKTGQNISISARLDNLITSGRHTNIISKGELNLSSATNTYLTVTGNMKSNIKGSVNEEVRGIDGYTRTITSNYTDSIGNNYKSTIGQNYTSTIGLDAQYNSRNSTHNTSESFSISAEKDVNITGKQKIDVNATDRIRVRVNNDLLIQSNNLGANVVKAINVSCSNMIIRCSGTYNVQINGSFVQSIQNNAGVNVGGFYQIISKRMQIKSNNISVKTDESNGPIDFQFGSGTLTMNGSRFTTSGGKLYVSTEFEAAKVWKAVYN